MKDKIEQIRRSLNELEREAEELEGGQERALVSGFELPDIIRDVVDLLLPELRPYEAAVYLYLLRHSVVETGMQQLRVSRRGLQSGVVKSAYAGSGKGGGFDASYKTVRMTLEALESIGAIRREADPDRTGTLYSVLLPEEIDVCRKARESRAAASPLMIDFGREADFYNVRENRLKVYDRDEYKCRYCEKQLTRFTATLDHVIPVSSGGNNSLENLVTACLDCNSRKNARPVGDFMAER